MALATRVGHVLDVIECRSRDAYTAGPSQPVQGHGLVQVTAVDVAALGDQVADADADAEGDAPVVGNVGVALRRAALHIGRAPRNIDDASEFHGRAGAGPIDDAGGILGWLGLDRLFAVGPDLSVRFGSSTTTEST